MDSEARCGTCCFWHSGLKQCRYNAPSLIVIGCGVGENSEYSNDWGAVEFDDWCGDYEAEEDEKEGE